MSLTSYFMLDVEDFGGMPAYSAVDNRFSHPNSHHMVTQPNLALNQMQTYSNAQLPVHPYVGVHASTTSSSSSSSSSSSTCASSLHVEHTPPVYMSHAVPPSLPPLPSNVFNPCYKEPHSSGNSDPSSAAIGSFNFGDQVVQCPATSTTTGLGVNDDQRKSGGKNKSDVVVAKRNARERRRVQAVNGAFSKLRKHIPYENRNKRLSKVKTLKIAIDYIHCLQDLLCRVDLGELKSTANEMPGRSGV